MTRPSAPAERVLAENRLRYGQLVDVVGAHATGTDVERVLRAATMAAHYAWMAPPGLLSDPVLERMVLSHVRAGDGPVVDGTRSGGHVLHVLSEAYAFGGHTRFARRWISRDHRRSHVALTNHHGPVPEQLLDAVTTSGGRVDELRERHAPLLERAQALRGLMDQADMVVLHVHPYDAVVLAAVNLPGDRPPVVLENHADHSYWLGVGAADVVSDFRPFGQRLSHELRGVAAGRSALLPIPVDVEASSVPRDEMRRKLGVPAGAVLGLTVATEAKMSPLGARGMDRLLDRALTWFPQLVVVLVGASRTGAWERLAARYPGRLLPVGVVPDPAPYYGAADVYLESYPTRSGTSVLEAAMTGLPTLALTDIPADDRLFVYQAGMPGLLGEPCAESPEEYVRQLRALVTDPELRMRRGAEVQAAVASLHAGSNWTSSLEALYDQARGSSAVRAEDLGERVEDPRYGSMLVTFATGGNPQTPDFEVALHPVAELDDPAMRADVLALTDRGRSRSLVVRAAPGWETRPEGATRLLRLAGDHPRLAVSLPFAAGDDAAGSKSTAVLVGLLSGLGQTPEDCGDISVDSVAPRGEPRAFPGDLPLSPTALDWLEHVLASPGWGVVSGQATSGVASAGPGPARV
ncbi:hypothetical protein KUM42_14635 [Modestobacter sp. L9-4]|uniref:hypothetical protein n=1 Tax=Modestobacter sp. L9-4 TaxID=2851567 RepID=UPI001C76ECE1|nr:hypothetical protein [Modestobacter sp. L9-4]QXG75070.1 hypothetical protein KUM42_14635 [Modestobacter sp. L9-4]